MMPWWWPPIELAFPAALGTLVLLPVLWWLLRQLPPAPRRQLFPAIRLLFGLRGKEDAAAHTPPWLLVLRLLTAVLVIAAGAEPILRPAAPVHSDWPMVAVIDDGWAAARDWNDRLAALDAALAVAARQNRPVILLTTARQPGGAAPIPRGPMTAAAARAVALALTPHPWPTDRAAARAAVAGLPRDRVTSVLWICDGLDDPDRSGTALATALTTLGGGVEVLTGQTGRILTPERQAGGFGLAIRRLPARGRENVAVRALDENGEVLGRADGQFDADSPKTELSLPLPSEIRNRTARLEIEGEAGAGAVALLDARWRHPVVGLVGANEQAALTPLLSPLFFVERALGPDTDFRRGDAAALAAANVAVMIVADGSLPQTDSIGRWVEGGGVLIRFAGPALAQAVARADRPDPLLPVPLRQSGGRTLGGTMSWTSAQKLAPMPMDGPLAGLRVPDDVTVTGQVLAEPGPDLGQYTWARLTDGTPLVTGRRQGRGWLILVHTTANSDWSTMSLSGLFVEMLDRMVKLADGTAPTQPQDAADLSARDVLDGFGHLHPATASTAALPMTLSMAGARIDARHPPGYYGQGALRRAVNLSDDRPALTAISLPTGVAVRAMDQAAGETALAPILWISALALMVLDALLSLWARGVIGGRSRAMMLGLGIAVALLPSHPGRAADLAAALSPRLAYIETGDPITDRRSQAGLAGLSRIIGQRSTARLAAPDKLNIARDTPLLYPLIYWPITPSQTPLSPAAAERLNAYLRVGGMLLLDSGGSYEQGDPAAQDQMRALTWGLDLPRLVQVTDEHVLTRTFYLLKDQPGRWNGPVWVASPNDAGGGDGVSPVVIGANDWAGAWAMDESGKPLLALSGGERQRETAIRFGVNLVMYALTGNYKADQVHVPAIMERLGR